MFCIGCIISIVAECKNREITQVKLVETFLKSIDKTCGELDSSAACNIAKGAKNPSGYVFDELGKLSVDSYEDIARYFQDQIVVLIKENDKNLVRDALILMIQEAQEISDDTVVDLIGGIKKSDLYEEDELASFLAGIYLYALKGTKNNIGGSAKKVAKEYLDRVKNGEKPLRKIINKEEKAPETKSEHFGKDKHSREIELLEEQNEQVVNAFCRKYEKEKDYIALCQVSYITNPTRNNHREMYNEFCECTTSTRNKILEINNVKRIGLSGNNWWLKYLGMFEKDYEKLKLGAKRYLYSFTQYFPRLLEYGKTSVRDYTQRIFKPNIITPIMKSFPKNYKHDVSGFIDEYIFYGNDEKYSKILEPPMDYMWRELDLGGCPELMLASFLALFIIGTCHSTPLQGNSENEIVTFSGLGVPEIETAEDLFYQTLLTLYENYEIAK